MFINRPQPLDDESLGGYLYRIAVVNYCTISDVARRLGVPCNHLLHSDYSSRSLSELSELTGCAEDALYKMSLKSYLHAWGTPLSKKLLIRSSIKYCPVCSKENLVHKLVWTVRPLSICFRHLTLLIDRCTHCSQPIALTDFMHGHCSQCNASFAEAEIYMVQRNSWLYRSQVDIRNRLEGNPGSGLAAHLRFTEFMKLAQASFHLIQGLPSFVEPSRRTVQAFYKEKGTKLNNGEIADAYANAFWMLWSKAHFYEVLDLFAQKHHDIKYEQKKQFEVVLGQKVMASVREVYQEYWLQQVDEGAARRDFSVFKQHESLLDRRKYISKEEAYHQWGVTPKNLEISRQCASLGIKTIRRNQKPRYLVKQADLRALLERERAFVTRKEAADLIGVHVNTLRVLIRAKLLSEGESPFGHRLVPIADIESFLHRCRGTCEKGAHGIRIHDAVTRYRQDRLKLTELVRVVQEGIISSSTDRRESNLTNIFVDQRELETYMKRRRNMRQQHQGYTLDEVRKILCVRDRTVHDMVKAGILCAKLGDSHHWWFDKKEIDRFRAEHIRLEQASVEYGVPRHRLYRWVKEGRLTNGTHGITRRPMLKHEEIKQVLDN